MLFCGNGQLRPRFRRGAGGARRGGARTRAGNVDRVLVLRSIGRRENSKRRSTNATGPVNHTQASVKILNLNLIKYRVRRVVLLRVRVEQISRVNVIRIRFISKLLTYSILAGRFRIITASMGNGISNRKGNAVSKSLLQQRDVNAQEIRLARRQGLMITRPRHRRKANFRVYPLSNVNCLILRFRRNRTARFRQTRGEVISNSLINRGRALRRKL